MIKSKIDQIWEFIKAHKVQILIFIGALIVFFFRRPDAITNAQFWAEDVKWFTDTYNHGFSIQPWFEPYAGYLTLIQRLIGWFAGFFPLEITPLVFNLCALSIQALPLVYLWSKRTDFISNKMKIFITVIYVCLPYTEEIHANVTNAQWFLGLALFLLVFMKEAQSRAVRIIDRFFILVASLSGPFAIFLMPIVALEFLRTRKISPRFYFVIFGAIVQLLCLIFTREPYGETNIGYSVTTFLQIAGGQVFGTGLFGYESLELFFKKPWIAPVIAVLGIEVLIYVFVKTSRELKYFIIYSSVIFIAALLSTLGTPPGMTWWYYFTTEAFGGRYYFMLHLAVYISLAWLVFTKVKIQLWLRASVAAVLLLSFLYGIPKDFVHRPYKNFDYKARIREYRQAKPGDIIIIPVNPGEFWQAVIVKK